MIELAQQTDKLKGIRQQFVPQILSVLF